MNAAIVLTLAAIVFVPITWLSDRCDLPWLGGTLTWDPARCPVCLDRAEAQDGVCDCETVR